jgi:hypothetical protein
MILFLFPILLFSQTNETEVQVNTFIKYSQHEPAIAVNNYNGEFIIVWTSENQDGDGERVFAQYFNNKGEKTGKEFQVNSNSKFDQNKASVAMNDNGITVVVWAETHLDSTLQDIYCAVYDKERKKVCEDFLVNTTTYKSQNCPDVGIDSQGNFVVVWHSWANDESDRAICAQRFNYKCERIGKEFVVNSYTEFSQCLPSIAMNLDGRFVISWQSWGQEGFISDEEQNYGVYAQLFDENGNRVGEEIHVNTKIEGDQFFSRSAINKNGDFIIVWTTWVTDTIIFGDIAGQRFNRNGEKIGEEFIVNLTIEGYQYLPDVAMYDDASFIVVWSSWKQDKSMEGIFLQRFDSHGKRSNQEEQVNIYFDNYQWEPRVTLLPDGTIVTVYSSWKEDSSEYDILLRILKK